jgi:hypothetical protein
MSDFLTWDQDVSNEPSDGGGFTLHEPGEYAFSVQKFERSQVSNPNSDYNKGFMAKLELDVEGARVYENVILHKKFEWKISALFRSLGLMDFPPAERWEKVLGSEGRCKVKVGTYVKDGEDRKKNELDFFIDKVGNTDFPTTGALPEGKAPEMPKDKLPWE